MDNPIVFFLIPIIVITVILLLIHHDFDSNYKMGTTPSFSWTEAFFDEKKEKKY